MPRVVRCLHHPGPLSFVRPTRRPPSGFISPSRCAPAARGVHRISGATIPAPEIVLHPLPHLREQSLLLVDAERELRH
jgi:hypothetical protein